jgi:hypothetical protein
MFFFACFFLHQIAMCCSYQTEGLPEMATMVQEYTAIATALLPWVDVFLAETLSTSREAAAALQATANLGKLGCKSAAFALLELAAVPLLSPCQSGFICMSSSSDADQFASSCYLHWVLALRLLLLPAGKPVWVSFTLEDSSAGCLRSKEILTNVVRRLTLHQQQPHLSALLVNCSAPAAVAAALPALKQCAPKGTCPSAACPSDNWCALPQIESQPAPPCEHQ